MTVMNGLQVANQDLTLDEYRELAKLRYQIRCFDRRCEQCAQERGMNSNAYLLLLAIQGLPEGAQPTIVTLADRLSFSAPTVNALVDEAVAHMDLIRSSALGDGTDWVMLTRTGRETLRRMAIASREYLEISGPDIAGALQSVIRHRRKKNRSAA